MNEISRCFGSYNKEKSFGIHMVHVVPCAGDKAKGKRQKAKGKRQNATNIHMPPTGTVKKSGRGEIRRLTTTHHPVR
ncbi:hypothetical protein [Dickeya dadantii]|uniref:hypothetical protein n=1 Tax=Dickeya dadantii TaxID=204038 RepID=UPI0013728571|nr:hypothetical protein [Dickeya dadantii]